MFTRCPDCQTLFRVRAEALRVAHGQVRCGRCGAQFNALDSLAEDPETLAAAREGAAESEAPDVSIPLEASPETSVDEGGAVQAQGAVAVPSAGAQSDTQPLEPDAGMATDFVPTGSPSEVAVSSGLTLGVIQEALLSEEPPVSWGPRLAIGGLVLLLLAVLGAQWVYMQRVPLYASPPWRPVLQRMCALLDCDLPLPRSPEQIEVLERVVREHPRVAKALLVDLTIVSRADEPIAYPIVELRLSDVSGNRVAGRQFTPAEYLPANLDVRSGLLPDKPLQISLELVAPETDAVSFQFDFL